MALAAWILREGEPFTSGCAQRTSRQVPCSAADLPEPTVPAGFGTLTPEEYRVAYRSLRQDLNVCPLRDPGTAVVHVEQALHGFDRTADVVVVLKPDVLLRRGDALVMREVKTTAIRL